MGGVAESVLGQTEGNVTQVVVLQEYSHQQPTIDEHTVNQDLSQDLETGYPKLVISKFLGNLFLKGHHIKIRLKP